MADVTNTPDIETVAKRARRYIQYEIDTKEREIAALRSYIDGLRKGQMLTEDVGDEISDAWERQKKLDTPVTA